MKLLNGTLKGFLLEEKKYFEALGKFDIKIVVNPLCFEPWYHKGLAFVYLREFGKAIWA
jgi:hypothetical protein